MVGLLLFWSVSKHNMRVYYGGVDGCCRLSVNTICGRFMAGIVVCCCRPSVNTISGRIIVGLVVHCRQSVNTICCRIMFGFVVVVVCQ